MAPTSFAVIDSDTSRRADVVRTLLNQAYTIPFDSLSAAVSTCPEHSVIFIHDEKDFLHRAIQALRKLGRKSRYIA